MCTHNPPHTRDELLKLRASLKDLPEDEKLDLLDVYSSKAGRERLKYLNQIADALFENRIPDEDLELEIYEALLARQESVDKVEYLEEEMG